MKAIVQHAYGSSDVLRSTTSTSPNSRLMGCSCGVHAASINHGVWSHVGQFAGTAALGAALVALAGTLEPGRASNWGRVAVVAATASVAVAAALQAVDGVALKSMVDRWAAAISQEQGSLLKRLWPYGRSRSGWPAS
jgi:hypothetical protein